MPAGTGKCLKQGCGSLTDRLVEELSDETTTNVAAAKVNSLLARQCSRGFRRRRLNRGLDRLHRVFA